MIWGFLPATRVTLSHLPFSYPQIVIHKLLSMFHPRPFVKTRFAPQGTVACIQAVAEFYYKIAFR